MINGQERVCKAINTPSFSLFYATVESWGSQRRVSSRHGGKRVQGFVSADYMFINAGNCVPLTP